MSDFQTERAVIRELAKRYREIAESPKHVRMRQRFKDNNDLKVVRPPLYMDEIPWFEMNVDGELDCVCEDDRLRGMEWKLRTELFREKHFACDNYIEPVWPVYKSYRSTGNGLGGKENTISVDARNWIVSHHWRTRARWRPSTIPSSPPCRKRTRKTRPSRRRCWGISCPSGCGATASTTRRGTRSPGCGAWSPF